MRSYLPVALAGLFLTLCRPSPRYTGMSPEAIRDSLLLLILKDTVATFRGVDIGEERATVEYLEGLHAPELKTRSTLIIRQDFPGPNCLYVRYTFLRDGTLRELVADAYLEKTELGHMLADALRAHFEKKLGPPASAMGVLSWRAYDVSGSKTVMVELQDESEEYGYGKVNITVYAL
jgi:hypothetical protein